MKRICKGCYAAITTGGHPMYGCATGCSLGYKTDGKGHPQEHCPKPKSWKSLKKEGGTK